MEPLTHWFQCVLLSVANIYGVDDVHVMYVFNNIVIAYFLKYLPCARQNYKCFTCIKSFNACNNYSKMVYLSLIFYRWGNWGTVRLIF